MNPPLEKLEGKGGVVGEPWYPTNVKLKCICCRKVIPKTKIFVIVVEIEIVNDVEDYVIKHMCGYCYSYVNKIVSTEKLFYL